MEREALGKPAEEGDRKRTLADKIKSMVAQLAGRKPKVRKFRDEETDGGGGMEGLKDLLDAWDPKLHPRAASGQKAGQSVPQGQGGVTSFTRHEPTKHDRPKREESALTKLKRARGEPQEKEVGPDVVAAFLKKEGWTPEDHKRDFSIWSKGAKMLAVRYDGNQVRDATLAEAKEGNGGPHFETRQGFQGLASLGQEKGEARDAASLPEIEPESTGATASKKGAVDQAAPLRSDLEPTKDARSIPKRATWHGLDVSIETPAGKERVGHSAEGLEWRVRMSHDYGYIRRTEGVDGDHVDVFLGPDPKSETVYVVTTLKSPGFKEPDEQKCMLDFPSEGDASKAFFDSYTDPRHFGSMEAVPVGQFIDKVLATKKKPEMIAKDGAWGTASYENDHAQDVLDIFRNHDKGSHDEGFREPVQESNLQNFLAYLDSIPTDDDFGKEKYLGPVILQAKESTDLPARYLAKAAEIIDGFLANESYLWKWKDPEARRASLEEERSFISKLLERHAKTGSTKPEKVADDAPWREEAHPRVKGGEGGGQFTSKGGEGAKAQEPEKPERAPRSASAVGKRGAPPR
jgi:hypothetical protein